VSEAERADAQSDYIGKYKGIRQHSHFEAGFLRELFEVQAIRPIFTRISAPGTEVMTDEYIINTNLPVWATVIKWSATLKTNIHATKTAFVKSTSILLSGMVIATILNKSRYTQDLLPVYWVHLQRPQTRESAPWIVPCVVAGIIPKFRL
jgi:hypothetical protein